ncbi:Bridging integrator 3 [Bagarius yarrelli]|uniref:Bridging integrator 3 n=1 Tax=Bagarius yarrelli TaxID=175774 RepID=A0A556UFS2_BAGYA|nr:Bridging integrator 3 [Bagarius yarrelli]
MTLNQSTCCIGGNTFPRPHTHNVVLKLREVVYFTEMHKNFSDLTDQLDQGGLTDQEREQQNEAKLNELRALSIVADD